MLLTKLEAVSKCLYYLWDGNWYFRSKLDINRGNVKCSCGSIYRDRCDFQFWGIEVNCFSASFQDSNRMLACATYTSFFKIEYPIQMYICRNYQARIGERRLVVLTVNSVSGNCTHCRSAIIFGLCLERKLSEKRCLHIYSSWYMF